MNTFFKTLIALCTLSAIFGGPPPCAGLQTAHAYAPDEKPAVKADPVPPKPVRYNGPWCHIKGKLYCSEYGTRYREPLMVVLTDSRGRYASPVSEEDGSFYVKIPVGEDLNVRVEFKDKGWDIGRVAIPASITDFERHLELYHAGSMLELVWELRDGSGENIDVKIKEQ